MPAIPLEPLANGISANSGKPAELRVKDVPGSITLPFGNDMLPKPRGKDTGQAVLGTVGVAGALATAPVSCPTGIGCVANATVATLSADAAYTGAKQAVSGQSENTILNKALQGLGLSPEAANYAELALGLGAAAKAGAVINAATEQAAKLNTLGKASYFDFTPNGVKATQAVMDSPQAQVMMREIKAASPGIDDVVARDRLNEWLQSGSSLPVQKTAAADSMLVKIVPKGDGVTPYSPYWMTPEQARAIATMTPEQAGQALGLPATQAWNMLKNGVDYYAITPKAGTNPTVFVSDIARTSQGVVNTSPIGQQVIVPNRGLWNDVKPIDPASLR